MLECYPSPRYAEIVLDSFNSYPDDAALTLPDSVLEATVATQRSIPDTDEVIRKLLHHVRRRPRLDVLRVVGDK